MYPIIFHKFFFYLFLHFKILIFVDFSSNFLFSTDEILQHFFFLLSFTQILVQHFKFRFNIFFFLYLLFTSTFLACVQWNSDHDEETRLNVPTTQQLMNEPREFLLFGFACGFFFFFSCAVSLLHLIESSKTVKWIKSSSVQDKIVLVETFASLKNFNGKFTCEIFQISRIILIELPNIILNRFTWPSIKS